MAVADDVVAVVVEASDDGVEGVDKNVVTDGVFDNAVGNQNNNEC